MFFLFSEIIYRPLYNLLVFVYNVVPFHDFGVAIILVTIIIKLILAPLSKKQIESQKKIQELQPKIKELQEKYKNDKEKQSRALMELYKTHKTNPFSGCLPLIFQLIFLIALYQVFFNISQNGLSIDGAILYPFVSNPGAIGHYFLGLVDLSRSIDISHLGVSAIPNIILVLLAAGAQYFQTKMLMPKPVAKKKGQEADMSQIMSQQMLYLGPLLTIFIGIKFPSGLALYWLASTVFAIIQQKRLVSQEQRGLKKKDNR